jgi:hypothetical protein
MYALLQTKVVEAPDSEEVTQPVFLVLKDKECSKKLAVSLSVYVGDFCS